MGLDVYSYKGLFEAVGNEALNSDGRVNYEGGWFRIVVDPDFPGREDHLKDQHLYNAKERDDFGLAYGAFQEFREWLAILAGWPDYDAAVEADEGPFWELLCFGDTDGTFGPITSAKLARDFATYQAKAFDVEHKGYDDEHHRDYYSYFREAFEMASENGAVRFL